MPEHKFTTEIEQEAIQVVRKHVTDYEEVTAFVTDKVAFDMRNLIKELRKAYWGIFSEPTDPVTGRKKIWIPLTETMVEAVVKNIDLDTKDINFRAKKASSIGLTAIVRNAVKNRLDEIYFGETLDQLERQLAIDGTVIWKTIKAKDEDGRVKPDIKIVDLLNFYIDPTIDSLHNASTTERAVLNRDEVRKMTGWIHTDEIAFKNDIHRTDRNFAASVGSGGELAEVYEHYGEVPKFLITGKKEDKDKFVLGHVIVSNIFNNPIVHLIETAKKKPYEECWYSKVPGRWYGRGVAEKVMMLQLWLNTIVNIRITRSYVSQLGVFKVKSGRGITPQMLSRLAVNGAVMVTDMDDIQQFVVQEASQASYTDEGNIDNWAQKVTQTFEAVTGEQLPASTTATQAALSSRAGQSTFVLIKEGIGLFLQRWFKRHYSPIIKEFLTKDNVVRLSGDFGEIKELDERIVDAMLYEKLEEMSEDNKFFDPAQIESERQRLLTKLSKMGKDRFTKLDNDMRLDDFDVQVFITNEEIDKGVLAQNLVSLLQITPNLQGLNIDVNGIVEMLIDTMGLDSNQLKKQAALTAPAGQMGQAQVMPQGGEAMMSPAATQMEAMAAANTGQAALMGA